MKSFSDILGIPPFRNHLIDNKDSDGNTALINAARAGNVAEVRGLIAANADLNIQNQFGYTALNEAVAYTDHIEDKGQDRKQVIRILIDAKADANIRPDDGAPENFSTYPGNPALHHAIHNTQDEIVEYLLEKAKADPNIKGFPNQNTPLISAIGKSNINIASLLVNSRADLELKDRSNQTALDIVCAHLRSASYNVSLSFIHLLLSHGAVVRKKDELLDFLKTFDRHPEKDELYLMASECKRFLSNPVDRYGQPLVEAKASSVTVEREVKPTVQENMVIAPGGPQWSSSLSASVVAPITPVVSQNLFKPVERKQEAVQKPKSSRWSIACGRVVE